MYKFLAHVHLPNRTAVTLTNTEHADSSLALSYIIPCASAKMCKNPVMEQ